MDHQGTAPKIESNKESPPEDEREIFQKIKDRLSTARYAAENQRILSLDFGESLPKNFEKASDEEIEKMVQYARKQIENNIRALEVGSDDEWRSFFTRFIRNIEYAKRYGLGNVRETLDALLKFAKRNRNNPEIYPPYATEYFFNL